jgi:hypothetical protein
MEKFQLSVLFKIIGIGSASGLLYHNDVLYIISDNSTYLYEYTIANEKLNKIALVENPQENIPKKDKPDFEAITSTQGVAFILGSGSTANRNQVYIYDPKTAIRETKDFTKFYQEIKTQLYLSDDELNIEGFIFAENYLFFFQRGNGANGKNGIICASDNKKKPEIIFIPFDLPVLKNNIAATFTDAILVEDKIYFLASAEDTTSTYLDGEVLGSIIGTIDFKTMKLESTLQISDTHKFEGLTLYKKTATEIEFLLCEDTDSEISESNIYKLVLMK